jgi:hypothetical protein
MGLLAHQQIQHLEAYFLPSIPFSLQTLLEHSSAFRNGWNRSTHTVLSLQ